MNSRFEKNIQQIAENETVLTQSVDEVLEFLPRTIKFYRDMQTGNEQLSPETFFSTKQIIKDCCIVLLEKLL